MPYNWVIKLFIIHKYFYNYFGLNIMCVCVCTCSLRLYSHFLFLWGWEMGGAKFPTAFYISSEKRVVSFIVELKDERTYNVMTAFLII